MLPALSRDYLKKGLFRNGFKGLPSQNPLSRLNRSMKRMTCVYRPKEGIQYCKVIAVHVVLERSGH